jgi:PAS domain-containing protein
MRSPAPPPVITIPSADSVFRDHVETVLRQSHPGDPAQLEARLRRLFPRVAVRERALSGEAPSWYVYRDGGWQASLSRPWWEVEGLPQVTISPEGWVTGANATARSLIGIEPSDVGVRHFTDFIAPGTLDDALSIFGLVLQGRELTATVLLRPSSGDVVAIDLHAARKGSVLTGVFRLAEGVELASPGTPVAVPELTCRPEADIAFKRYAELALSRMPEPTPELLALRLRRLYPHAHVDVDGLHWTATRDAQGLEATPEQWWLDAALPRVQYDAQALILDANDAARDLLGSTLVGHYWQEYVTPGSTEQVSAMLAILAEVGAAESRFRMPAADGSLVEFDSYTTVEGENFTTVMRPRR